MALAVEPGTQRFARDIRHDVVEQTVSRARVEQRQQVREMLQVGGDLDLRKEALGPEHGAKLPPEVP